jgi:hypothetical protein
MEVGQVVEAEGDVDGGLGREASAPTTCTSSACRPPTSTTTLAVDFYTDRRG